MANNVTLQIGPITVKVKVAPAVDEESSGLNMICAHEHPAAGVEQIHRCKSCQREGGRAEFPDRGKVNTDGTVTTLAEGTLDAASAVVTPEMKASLVMTAHPAQQVDVATLPQGKFYFLAPIGADGNYPLIVDMLKRRPDLTFCTLHARSTAPNMFRLGIRGDVLTMQQLAFPDKMRAAPGLITTNYDERFSAVIEQFADSIVSDFDPTTYADVRSTILAKGVEGGTASTEVASTTPVVAPDNALLVLLQGSIDAAKPKAVRKPRARKPKVELVKSA